MSRRCPTSKWCTTRGGRCFAYAALVLEHVIRIGKPRQIVFSALGVREGLLYSLLKQKDKEKDALIEAARDLNLLRSRSPRHGEELIELDRSLHGVFGSRRDRRGTPASSRRVPAWRISAGGRIPIIAANNRSTSSPMAALPPIDHPGRAYLALAVFYRHVGLVMDDELSPRLRELASTRMIDRARVLGAALRLAYVVSAAMPGVLPRTPLAVERQRLALRLPGEFAALGGERVLSRLRALSRLIGREPVMLMG